jgi:SynChlorMet cassette radical SAM/SPASM protein ScmF
MSPQLFGGAGVSDRRLVHLYVNPSSECNLSCAHCWIVPDRSGLGFSTRDRRPEEFTVAQFSGLLAAASGLGLKRLKFTGSEPLLRADFAGLYSAAVNCPASPEVDIETNGTLEPPGLWEALGAHPPGLVSVSLDSTESTIHDGFRGVPGAWDRTRGFIGRLTAAGILTQVIMSVPEPEIEPVLRMAMLCREMRVHSLKVNPVQPMGRGVQLTGGVDRAARMIDFSRRVHSLLGASVMVDMPPAFMPLNRLAASSRCPLLSLLGVLPDGGISFCGIGFSCPSLVMGNFLRDDLAGIWRSAAVLDRLRNDLSIGLNGICGDCIHETSCMGNCVMQNYSTTGSFREPFWLCAEAERSGLFPPSRRAGWHAQVHPQS